MNNNLKDNQIKEVWRYVAAFVVVVVLFVAAFSSQKDKSALETPEIAGPQAAAVGGAGQPPAAGTCFDQAGNGYDVGVVVDESVTGVEVDGDKPGARGYLTEKWECFVNPDTGNIEWKPVFVVGVAIDLSVTPIATKPGQTVFYVYEWCGVDPQVQCEYDYGGTSLQITINSEGLYNWRVRACRSEVMSEAAKASGYVEGCSRWSETKYINVTPAVPLLDADGDGVPDSEDLCPTEAGPAENDGCPEIEEGTLVFDTTEGYAIFKKTPEKPKGEWRFEPKGVAEGTLVLETEQGYAIFEKTPEKPEGEWRFEPKAPEQIVYLGLTEPIDEIVGFTFDKFKKWQVACKEGFKPSADGRTCEPEERGVLVLQAKDRKGRDILFTYRFDKKAQKYKWGAEVERTAVGEALEIVARRFVVIGRTIKKAAVRLWENTLGRLFKKPRLKEGVLLLQMKNGDYLKFKQTAKEKGEWEYISMKKKPTNLLLIETKKVDGLKKYFKYTDDGNGWEVVEPAPALPAPKGFEQLPQYELFEGEERVE